jgi:hypothetical protein
MSQSPEIEAVSQTLTADLPALEAADRAAAWARVALVAPAARSRRRPAGFRVALSAGVLAAVLWVIVALSGGGGPGPRIVGPIEVPTADAAAILARVAEHLGQGRALVGTQARVIRETWLQLVVNAAPHRPPVAYVLPRTTESGYDALGGSFYEELPDGSPRFANVAAKAAYVREFGPYVPIPPKPRIESHPGANPPDPNYLNLSAHAVLTLPSDPAALEARLVGQRSGLIAQDEPHDLVYLASRLLTFGPTPPAVQAALARLLATLPGVRRVGAARIGGRPADILAFPAARGVGVAERLAFDRRTGALLEEIDVLVTPGGGYPGVKPGTVINAIAYSTTIAPTLDTRVQPPAVTPADAPRP